MAGAGGPGFQGSTSSHEKDLRDRFVEPGRIGFEYRPGGCLLVETSERQAPRALEAFARDGLIARVISSSELNAAIVVGTRPGPPTRPD